MKLAIPRPRKRPVAPPPPPELDAIEWRGRRIDFTVIRSHRRKRTVGLRVLGGVVEVRAPVRTSQRRVREFVQAKGSWVVDKLIEHRERPKIPPFGYGESVPYLGRNAAITIEPGPVEAVAVGLHDEDCNVFVEDPGAIYLGRWHFHVTAPQGMEGDALSDSVREALVAWYRAQAAEVIQRAVDECKPFVAPRAKPVVRISGARAQWGSCSADGVLRFSWRCLMLDEQDIEYVAVHELAHLKVRNHSKAFWRVVTKAMPNALDVRRGITRASRTLPR